MGLAAEAQRRCAAVRRPKQEAAVLPTGLAAPRVLAPFLGPGRLPRIVGLVGRWLGRRKREIDAVSEDRKAGNGSNGICEPKILLMRDDDPLNALVLHRARSR